MVRDALAGNKALAIARLKPGFESNYEGRPAVFDVCGAGVIVHHVERDDGRYDILVRGVARVRIVNEHAPLQTYRLVNAELLPDTPTDPELAAAFHERLRTLWPALATNLPEGARESRDLHARRPKTRECSPIDSRERSSESPSSLSGSSRSSIPAERMSIITNELREISERLSTRPPRRMN